MKAAREGECLLSIYRSTVFALESNFKAHTRYGLRSESSRHASLVITKSRAVCLWHLYESFLLQTCQPMGQQSNGPWRWARVIVEAHKSYSDGTRSGGRVLSECSDPVGAMMCPATLPYEGLLRHGRWRTQDVMGCEFRPNPGPGRGRDWLTSSIRGSQVRVSGSNGRRVESTRYAARAFCGRRCDVRSADVYAE